MQVIAKQSVYGLIEGQEYTVIEREGSFVTVQDSEGRKYGEGEQYPWVGRPTIGFDRFTIKED